MADQALLQYDTLVIRNEVADAIAKANATLAGVVDPDDAPVLARLLADLNTAVGDCEALVAAIGAPPQPDAPAAHVVGVSIAASKPNPSPGDRVDFKVTFRNDGGTEIPAGTQVGIGIAVAGTQVTWCAVAGPIAAGAAAVGDTSVGGGLGGGSWTVPASATAQTYQVGATIDDKHAVQPVPALLALALSATAGPAATNVRPGTRDPKLSYGSRANPFNQPLCDGITFRGTSGLSSGDPLLVTHYGMTVYGAGYAVLDQTDPENHRMTVQPDGIHAIDGYGRPGSKYFSDNLGTFDLRGDVAYYPQGADRNPAVAGTIRDADIAAGLVAHRLNLLLTNPDLRLGWVWPAFGQDGDAANSYQGGSTPIGGVWAIPSAAAGVSTTPDGLILERALRHFGAHVRNRAGNRAFGCEATTRVLAWANRVKASGDAARIFAALRPVTLGLITPTQRGGPGKPMDLYAADFA